MRNAVWNDDMDMYEVYGKNCGYKCSEKGLSKKMWQVKSKKNGEKYTRLNTL